MSSLRACHGDLPLFCWQQFAPGWRLPSRRKDPVVSLQNRLPGRRQWPWLRLAASREGDMRTELRPFSHRSHGQSDYAANWFMRAFNSNSIGLT
jgi:hypothetical protein